MNQQTKKKILLDTLEDMRVSRAERRALREVIRGMARDYEQRRQFMGLAFEIAKERVYTPNDRQLVDWLEQVVQLAFFHHEEVPDLVADACFSRENDCAARLVSLIDQTRRTLDVCVFTLTDDRLRDAIVRAHERHVGVRIITDDDKAGDRGADIDVLRRAGIAVRMDRSPHHMHHKFAVFDDSRLVTGSYNWTVGAARYNDENFIVTSDERLLSRFRQAFEKLWLQFE